MRLLRNEKREEGLFNKIKDVLEAQEREGIHASDLLAPRLAYFRRTHPLPLSEDQVGYFAGGQGHHMFLLHLETGSTSDTDEGSNLSEEYGISYSPDLAKKQAEFKTARFIKEPETEAESIKMFDEYIKQCLVYALCEGKSRWHLYVLFIGLRAKMSIKPPRLRCYTLVWTKEELEEGREWIHGTVNGLHLATKKKTVKHLPLCAEFKCVRFDQAINRKKIVCGYFAKCKPEGRWKQYKDLLS